ncbi:MAG TPA: tetratricopeptide repeat protein [Anaerolineae bacterium]|jgi:tetratricopeptide (TPR) repeat protein|nr:tetratricopeptide repeat protein [Anaerolineae bacterium]
MAQGEFALVREILIKAIQRPSVIVSDHDVYAVLVDAAVQQRDTDGLREYAPALEEAITNMEHNLYLATAHRAWGVLHRLEGQYDQAKARLLKAVALFEGLDTHWQLGRTHFELGELAADREQPAEAKQHYARALTLFEEMGAMPDAKRARDALSSYPAEEVP